MLPGCLDEFIVNGRCRNDVALADQADPVKTAGFKVASLRAVQQLRLGCGNAVLSKHLARQMLQLKQVVPALAKRRAARRCKFDNECLACSGSPSVWTVLVNLGCSPPAEEPAGSRLLMLAVSAS